MTEGDPMPVIEREGLRLWWVMTGDVATNTVRATGPFDLGSARDYADICKSSGFMVHISPSYGRWPKRGRRNVR